MKFHMTMKQLAMVKDEFDKSEDLVDCSEALAFAINILEQLSGVLDKKDNTFYICKFGEHWETLKMIIEDKYNMRVNRENEDFLLSNFELIGALTGINAYFGIRN